MKGAGFGSGVGRFPAEPVTVGGGQLGGCLRSLLGEREEPPGRSSRASVVRSPPRLHQTALLEPVQTSVQRGIGHDPLCAWLLLELPSKQVPVKFFCACLMEGESCRQGPLFIRHEMILATPSHEEMTLPHHCGNRVDSRVGDLPELVAKLVSIDPDVCLAEELEMFQVGVGFALGHGSPGTRLKEFFHIVTDGARAEASGRLA